MSTNRNLRLPFGEPPGVVGRRPLRDDAARAAAVDPTRNTVLEASAGTGKTRVLVDRYVNLLRAGVEPLNILAITFTRKAAAEMRQRIVARLREAASLSAGDEARWRDLRDRLNEIAISTIDAFCLSLLREFPLEADLDPGFDIADETAVPRLIDESLDRAMRICRALAPEDEGVALLFTQLGERRLRLGLAALLDKRLVADQALDRVLARGPRDVSLEAVCRNGVARLAGALESVPGGLDAFLADGPAGHPVFDLLAGDIRALVAASHGGEPYPPALLRGLTDRLFTHFFTKKDSPRQRMPRDYARHHGDKAAARRHMSGISGGAARVADAIAALRRDLHVVLSRAVRRVFRIAAAQFRHTLEQRGVLDFTELLARATLLLGQMEEFARSRYLLEARYQHVLVDEFQDTSRAQWELVAQLIRAWGEGSGTASGSLEPSIFIVGDRKQSIYGFRQADVSLLDAAAVFIEGLRPNDRPLRTITTSFRSVPPLLAFANDLFLEVQKAPERADAFRYDERDCFPVEDDPAIAAPAAAEPAPQGGEPALGLVAAGTPAASAAAVAAEIQRLLETATVRDRTTGVRRRAVPGDVAILFRTRETHRQYEQALESLRIPTYVYKGLGFFDAEEIKDIVSLVRYLANPLSNLRAAAFLRSRFVRLSDPGLQRLAPGLARAIADREPPPAQAALDDEDRRVLDRTRSAAAEWLRLADTIPPAELLDRVLADTAYAYELRGQRLLQARENVKKIRGLIRRVQNRGYLTLGRLSSYLEGLSAGDESNAAIDAVDAVNLMTIHAAKGLEFPIVFVVNLGRAAGGGADPIRVSAQDDDEDAVAIGEFRAEFDDDARPRDMEEAKRLLYVAVTRARDRLYLGATLPEGVFRATPGSLASFFPAGLKDVFGAAAAAGGDDPRVEWMAVGGARHEFRVCPVPAAAAAKAVPLTPAVEQPEPADERPAADLAEVVDPAAVVRVAVTAVADRRPEAARGRTNEHDGDRLLAGRLVHRLFQFGGIPEAPALDQRARCRQLVLEEERHAVADLASTIDDAVAMYARLRESDVLRDALDGSTCVHEVPFSLRLDAPAAAAAGLDAGGADPSRVVVRGVIDCLAFKPDHRIVVIDFKTGAPRPADASQMDVYVAAARALFPDSVVEGRLVYEPGGPPAGGRLAESAKKR